MRSVWRWLAAHQFVAFLIVLTLVAVPAYWQVQHVSDRQERDITCVESWADESAARSKALGALSRAVDDANDELWREFARQLASPKPDRAAFEADLRSYLRASDTYNAARRDNPVPESPKLRC